MFTKKVVMFLLLTTGILSVILSMFVFNLSLPAWINYITYGSDAYTDIQNATAQAANNIRILTDAVSFGFGSVLLVVGLSIMCSSCYMLITLSESNANTPKEILREHNEASASEKMEILLCDKNPTN